MIKFYILLVFISLSVLPIEKILPTENEVHIENALNLINLSKSDLGFEKAIIKQDFVFNYVLDFLKSPLDLPKFSDDLLEIVTHKNTIELLNYSHKLLEILPSTQTIYPTNMNFISPFLFLPKKLKVELNILLNELYKAQALVKLSLNDLTAENMSFLANYILFDYFHGIDDTQVRTELSKLGIRDAEVTGSLSEFYNINPEASTLKFLSLLNKVDLDLMLKAQIISYFAILNFENNIKGFIKWPKKVSEFETPIGLVAIGTNGNDTYTKSYALIIDPAGDDIYTGFSGVANGIKEQFVSIILDFSGNDTYLGKNILGPGSSLFGISILRDHSGDDKYSMPYAGEAASLFGIALLEDLSGNDNYEAYQYSQAASTCGLAILKDYSGNDNYNVGLKGQAYSSVKGVALLIDESGEDTYFAGNVEHDYERWNEHYLSLSQGFSIGIRPFSGGGFAALIDLSGDDTYVADVYGQGVSYWFSLGMLIDLSGNDRYSMYEYGQGSGIHLSLGMLADFKGNDVYQGYSLAQGNSHDYGVGFLFDHEGNDTYTADHQSQGRGMTNAIGILLDTKGNDSYFCRDLSSCQGIGNNTREYGSIALLLDLSGLDSYSAKISNGTALKRADYGVIYDYEPKDAK